MNEPLPVECSHFHLPFLLGSGAGMSGVSLELVHLMPLNVLLDPALLGKGFWTVCFGVLGHLWFELGLSSPPLSL